MDAEEGTAQMSDIRESQVIKRDGSYQLQRVITVTGEKFLTKFAVPDYCDMEELLLEKEYALFTSLRSEHVLAPTKLVRMGDKLVAHYADFDGLPLSNASASQLDLTEFGAMARELCAAVGVLHERGFMLGAIEPGSFLRSPSSQRIRLADAAFARKIAAHPEQLDPRWLGSTYLPYAAPELLGPSAQAADNRADLYALGGVLYHLLCGRAPFVSHDPGVLVQSHLARTPPSPQQFNPKVPSGLSEIVLRLLSKNPLDRHASTRDLERAVTSEASGAYEVALTSTVAPDGMCTPRSLTFSEKLHGRDDALRFLKEETRRDRASPCIIFIEGDAGVGKTSLLQELQRAVPLPLLMGRFNRSGNSPLSGWATALRGLANLLLLRQSNELEAWKLRILSALGEGAPLIAALVPEWEAILKSPTRPNEVTLDTNLNRIAVAIRSLLSCFAASADAAVVVLDDLQWADTSSVRILELVLALPEPTGLLVLAAVRNEESSAGQCSISTELRDNLNVSGVTVQRLSLGPWSEPELRSFIEHSFMPSLHNSSELIDLIYSRTHGNPFFVKELLGALSQQGTFEFDPASAGWCWKKQAVRRLPLTEDVVSLLSQKLRGLPEASKEAAKVAACLGTDFTLADFCVAANSSIEEATAHLGRCVVEGLIAITGRESRNDGSAAEVLRSEEVRYEFVHDRVFEACRGLIRSEERGPLHLSIGRALLRSPAHAREQWVYQVAGHFNQAVHLLDSPVERVEIAALNLRTGILAKLRGAPSQALEYLRAGLALLNPIEAGSGGGYTQVGAEAWQSNAELARSLHEEGAEAALLNGDLDLMHRLCDAALLAIPSSLDKVAIYTVRIRGLSAEKKFGMAVDVALEILRELGVKFPQQPTVLHAIAGYVVTKRQIARHSSAHLATLPRMQDPVARAVARIIQSVYAAAYLGRPSIFPLLAYRHVRDSLTYGSEAYSSVTFSGFAVVLAAMGDFDTASRVGKVGLELLRRFESERLKAQVFMGYYTFVLPWRQHMKDSLPFYEEGLQAALEHGDFEFACYIMTMQSLSKLHSGARLNELAPEMTWRRAKIASLRQERSILLQDLLCQVAHDLQHAFPAHCCLTGPFYDESTMLARCLDPVDHNLVFHNYLAKTMVCWFVGNYDGAREAARHGYRYVQTGAFAHYLGPVFVFYAALSHVGSGTSRSKQGLAKRRFQQARTKLKRLAATAPMNFANKYRLIEAEHCRISGRHDLAAEHYERAIELSQEHGLVQECAVAQERAAHFYLERSMTRLGRHYLREACMSYTRWGSTAAIRRLESQYPQHFALLVASSEPRASAERGSLSESLDYRVLLKASQAISSEVLLPRLLERLFRAIFEHAGAQRGLLILERQGQLVIEAEADVDGDDVEFLGQETVDGSDVLCAAVVYYAARTGKPLLLSDAAHEGMFVQERYVRVHQPRSILCTPVLYQGKLLGLVYLENNRMSHVFTETRLEIVNLLTSQAAISIANARFHALQMEAQQAKINPHFLFNALSSIAELAVVDGRKAEQAIVKLSQLYRYVLTTSMEHWVTLEQELEIVRSYLELEKLRFDAKLEFSVSCEGDAARVALPGLLIQPLVENGIRHGVGPKLSPGRVSVHASVGPDRCSIAVQDDGVGGKSATAGAGFGLRSVQERLALAYGQRYSLAITQSPGYLVELEIPLEGSKQAAPFAQVVN